MRFPRPGVSLQIIREKSFFILTSVFVKVLCEKPLPGGPVGHAQRGLHHVQRLDRPHQGRGRARSPRRRRAVLRVRRVGVALLLGGGGRGRRPPVLVRGGCGGVSEAAETGLRARQVQRLDLAITIHFYGFFEGLNLNKLFFFQTLKTPLVLSQKFRRRVIENQIWQKNFFLVVLGWLFVNIPGSTNK